MKKLNLFALLATLLAGSAWGDVEALYWQVTSEMNSGSIKFAAAAFAAVDKEGHVTYLEDSAGNAWQAANDDMATTAAIASILGSDYSSGYSFYIELMNQDGDNWYTAGVINKGGSNYSWSDIQSHIYSSSSMSISMATPLTSGSAHVPEPTSGLLLVLGGACLALRRRHG